MPVPLRSIHVIDEALLRGVELFATLDDDSFAAVVAAARTEDVIRGDVVFAQEATAETLYVVVSGRIAISNRSVDGRESMFALMERGDLSRRDELVRTSWVARRRPERWSRPP